MATSQELIKLMMDCAGPNYRLQLTAHDALGAHARDELGIHETTRARPIQAAVASAASFAAGAAPPAVFAAWWPVEALTPGVAARLGGAVV